MRRKNLTSTSRSVSGPTYAVVTQHTVVIATVTTSATWVLNATPCDRSASNPTDTTNELIIATISHHALTRHQNQRTRYSSPVPAPTWRMTSNTSFAVSSR